MTQDVYDYKYLGKPDFIQVVKGSWVRVDQSTYTAKNKGVEGTLVYFNVSDVEFNSGEVGGALEFRLVRHYPDGTKDNTFYDDLPVDKNKLKDGVAKFTRVFFESGEGSKVKTYMQIKCIGELKQVTLNTRYRKIVTIKDKG